MEKEYLIINNDYISIGTKLLMEVGVPEEHAEITMLSLLDADQKGVYTHGFFRLSTYLKQIARGNINPKPVIEIKQKGTNIRLVDGNGGLGSVVSYYAMKEAIEISRERGVGVVGVKGSNHFGTAAYYAEMAAAKGKIGIVMTNASPAIAPTGGKKVVLGNNPWSISVCSNLGYPITLDMANSIARGKIRLKALTGESIPVGWALNREGEPTTNAKEALEGIILPIGDHKGYGIALMIDLLAGVLTGAQFGIQNPGVEENGKRNNGHLFISLNIEAFMSMDEFNKRTDELIEMIRSVPKIDENKSIFLPGEIEWENKLSQKKGTTKIPERIIKQIELLCKERKVLFPILQEVN
ncbi:Ldh family oxidoreductase [Psychrobacillus sp. NPDC093180]|uniref:Ldh family oxidoreductase n=1 Tax=Psychrobacillus sp. NPDC093180 TaxID=3364489 RepID=UPI00380A54AE